MQKHDVKNAQGTSGTQQPNQKKGMNDTDKKQQGQKQGDRNNQSSDDFNSPQRSK